MFNIDFITIIKFWVIIPAMIATIFIFANLEGTKRGLLKNFVAGLFGLMLLFTIRIFVSHAIIPSTTTQFITWTVVTIVPALVLSTFLFAFTTIGLWEHRKIKHKSK